MYFSRVNACVKYGWDKSESKGDRLVSPEVEIKYPDSGWLALNDRCTLSDSWPEFNMSHIVTYFVTQRVNDSLPAGDFKSMNNSAENLFRCGHVQNIQLVTVDDRLFVKAECLPEMRKDRVYCVQMALQCSSSDIVGAECGCPAGRGPTGSCKHIGALSYALADFIRFRKSPEYQTCTDTLQQWNRPRARKVEPIPVNQLGDRRRELIPTKVRAKGSQMIFDPRPLHLRQPDLNAIEVLRCDLLAINRPCGFISLLVPPVEKVMHDHSYAARNPLGTTHTSVSEESVCTCSSMDLPVIETPKPTAEVILSWLHLNEEERSLLEEKTRTQSSNPLWFQARQNRITGSTCGRIIEQRWKTAALLRYVIYPKPMLHLPKAIKWGRCNEEKARQAYQKYMEEEGHEGIQVREAGFLVHDTKGWLGASTDGWVVDPLFEPSNGMIEIKCPYSMAEKTPEEISKEKDFYFNLVDGCWELRKKHPYYHQVQLQLLVASDRASWCDFCVFTVKGVCVQRIFPDKVWQKESGQQLDEYFFDYILPELFPQCKPSYYL